MRSYASSVSSRRDVALDVILAGSLGAWGQAEVWNSGASLLVGPRWANAKLGAYTAWLHNRPLVETLEVLKSNGLTTVEVNARGVHPLPALPCRPAAVVGKGPQGLPRRVSSRGIELTGLNSNGNPLNPLPGVGPKHTR
jgi:hypothetical protein